MVRTIEVSDDLANIYIYIIIIIIRVWALAWMNEKAELIKSFTQCDCGGKIMYKIKIILNKILDYNINFYPGYQ